MKKIFRSALSVVLSATMLMSSMSVSAVAGQTSGELPNNAQAIVARGDAAFQKSDYQFSANWIWDPSDDGQSNRWMTFRKDVTLDSVPEKVTAKIAADTKYWLYINGELAVFEGQLKRGAALLDKDIYPQGDSSQPDLDHMIQEVATYYDEVDLTPYLKEGNNTIVALVWYFGNEGHSHVGSGQGGFLFESQMGDQMVISDDTWKVSRQMGYQPSNPMGGYTQEYNINYDAREGFNNFYDPDFDTSSWNNAKIVGKAGDKPWNELWPRTIPEWKVWDLATYSPDDAEYVTKIDATHYRLKLPTNIQFTPYLKVEAPAGKVIKISCPNSVNSNLTYTTMGGNNGEAVVQEYESPSWINWWYIDFEIPEDVKVLELGYRQSGYNTEFEGYFNSDDEFFNTLWTKARDTAYVNMRDTFMDCPDRERAPWLGDAVNEMEIAYYSMSTSVYDMVRKDISTRVNWQNAEGVIPSTAPTTFRYNEYAELTGQSLAGVMSWFQYYLWSGDRDTLENSYEALQKYMEMFDLDVQNYTDPFVRGSGTNTMHTNWIDWGPNMDQNLSLNIWAYIGVKTLCNYAEALNDTENLATYEALRDAMHAKFDATFWNGQEYRSQTYTGPADDRGQALAVYAGLVSPDKYPQIRDILLNNQFASPYMVKYSIEALYMMGYTAEAEQRMKESYANDVALDDPTFSENWNGGGSKNHGWSGGGLISLSGYAAGVRPLEAGYDKFIVAPQMDSIQNISAGIPTVKGLIEVKANNATEQFDLSVNVPGSSTAVIGVPRLKEGNTMVVCDGKVIWNNGTVHDAVDGLTYAYSDENHIFFNAQPGNWSLSAVPAQAESKTEYTLTIPALENGTILVNGEQVALPYTNTFAADSQVTLTAQPNENYLFDIFNGSVGKRDTNEISITMNADYTIGAEFVPEWKFDGKTVKISSNSQDIKLSINGAEVSNPFSGLYETNGQVTVKAVPGEDVAFLGWRNENGETVSTDPEYTFTLEEDTQLTAMGMSMLGENLALHKPATASTNISNGMFDVSKVTDGVYTITGQNEGWTSDELREEQWVYIDLGESKEFDTIKVYPRHNGVDNGYGIPINMEILVSNDAQNWTTVKEIKDIPRIASGTHSFKIDTQNARYIKLNGSKLRVNPNDGNRTRFQVSEIEVYNSTAKAPPVIDQQPKTVETKPGTTITFTVGALSVTPMSYQWYVSTDNGNSWSAIPDATNFSYSILGSTENSGYQYYCAVSNEYGTTNSNIASYSIASDNYALKQPFEVSSNQVVDPYFMAKYINDGITDTLVLQNEGWTSAENHGGSEWVIIDMESVKQVSRVKLYPRYDGTNNGYGIPIDYNVQVSKDGETWTTVYSATDVERPTSGAIYLDFDPVDARYVKFEGTKLRANPMDDNRVRMQIAEFEIYNTNIADTNKHLLNTTIEKAEVLLNSEEFSNAIPSVQESFQKTLEQAKKISQDIFASQESIDTIWKELLNEIHKLGFQKGDKTALQAFYDEVKDTDLSQYRDGAAKENFKTALANAETVLADENALQNEIDKAYNDLKAAYDALEKLADKSQLKALLDECAIYQEADYTPATWNVFADSFKNAQDVYNNMNASQEEVNTAVDELLSGMLQLRFQADKSILEELVNQLESMDLSGYTDESVAALNAALSQAKAILDNPEISVDQQDIVDLAVDSLTNAVSGLEKSNVAENIASSTENENNDNTVNSNTPVKTGDAIPMAGATILFVASATILFSRKKK